MKTFTLNIDGRRYEVDAEGKNLLHTCLSLGLNLPYFCWHPALHSVGACRQCAVKVYKDEADTRGRIVMSCMTPVTDGMRLSVEDPEVRSFRSGITELLMVNHPHDCPICDEGGECHLQDMVVMTGHNYRRYRFTKRTHRNQDLGPFLNHEMNRCIQCYRCIRFYRDYAGGTDLEALGAHDDVYFGRQTEGTLENEFSGNLVEVCPTGVFTDKTLKAHYSRKWDLQTAPSICAHCAVGCNTIPGERYGLLRRVRTRYNSEVNGYFLCDRGRYGYEFVNSERRLRKPTAHVAGAANGGGTTEIAAEEAVNRAAAAVKAGTVIGIGSPRASVETNYALRSLVGRESFFVSVSDHDLGILRLMTRIIREGAAPVASVRRARQADAVLVLGEDAWNTAPVLALNLRQAASNAPAAAAIKQKKLNAWDDAAVREAIRHEKGPFFVATVEETKLDEVARESLRLSPSDIALLGFAVAHEIDASSPAPAGIAAPVKDAAVRIAAALKAAEKPLVVSGSALADAEVIRAAANVARALRKAGKEAHISLVFPEANSLGACLLEPAGGLEAAQRALASRSGQTLVVAEADLFRALPEKSARTLLSSAAHIICVDHTSSRTTEAAELALPSCTFAESSGSLVSMEGRAQRFFSVMPPVEPSRAAWRWIDEIAVAAGKKGASWQALDEVIQAVADELPALKGVKDAAPRADYRLSGRGIPRKSLRESGRTAVTANVAIHEPQPPRDPDSPLVYSMEGSSIGAPASLNARFWSPGWNSDQSLTKFQAEVSGQLVGGDPGVRLFEPASGDGLAWFTPGPAAPQHDGTLRIVPRHLVFGSEELSALSPGVASRIPPAAIALSRQEAEKRGLRDGGKARLAPDGGEPVELQVVVKDMPPGVASVSPGVAALSSPARATVTEAR